MLDFALSAFVTLLLVVDPVGLAPAFLAATGGMPDNVKRTIALRAPLIAASIPVGAIATTLLPAGDAGYGARLALIIAVIVSVGLLCVLCFVSASLSPRTLGRTGNAVHSRVLGVLAAAYSVQFVINGIAAVGESPP